MDTRFKLAALAVAIVTTGCGSSNDLIADRVNPVNGAPSYRTRPATTAALPEKTPVELRADTIYSAAVDELRDLVSYVRVPDSVISNVQVQKVGLDTEITFTSASTPKGFFPPGAYALHRIDRNEDRSGLVYADLVATAARKVLDRIKDKTVGDIRGSVEATYSAQADGLPVKSSLKYKGEFGNIVLTREVATLNGQPAEVRIAPGQSINNTQLAALRAVSLASFFHGQLGTYPVSDRYVLTTTGDSGPEHRWVKMEIKISPAIL
jgi:hypothetical protein